MKRRCISIWTAWGQDYSRKRRARMSANAWRSSRSEEHTSELQSPCNLVCRLLLAKTIRSAEHTSELQSPCNLVCRLLLEEKHSLGDAASAGDPDASGSAALFARRRAHPLTGTTRSAIQELGRVRHAFNLFFFNDSATTEIYTLSLHDVLPI